jgi:hypothetical protein
VPLQTRLPQWLPPSGHIQILCVNSFSNATAFSSSHFSVLLRLLMHFVLPKAYLRYIPQLPALYLPKSCSTSLHSIKQYSQAKPFLPLAVWTSAYLPYALFKSTFKTTSRIRKHSAMVFSIQYSQAHPLQAHHKCLLARTQALCNTP